MSGVFYRLPDVWYLIKLNTEANRGPQLPSIKTDIKESWKKRKKSITHKECILGK